MTSFFKLFTLLLLIATSVLAQNAPDCGTRGPNWDPIGRIVGGEEATPHEFPWMASLEIELTPHSYCGASVIHPRWALTAAHCKDAMNRHPSLLLGAHNLSAAETTQIRRKVVRMVVHPDYKAYSPEGDYAFFDVALLKLDANLDLSGMFVAPVCVPEQNNATDTMVGKVCTATGWGHLTDGSDLGSDTLQKVNLPIISLDECNSMNASPDAVPSNFSNICTFLKEKDACQGDSGGPLNCKVNNRWYVTGVTSWGKGCADKYPGVWANTAAVSDWIWKIIREETD